MVVLDIDLDNLITAYDIGVGLIKIEWTIWMIRLRLLSSSVKQLDGGYGGKLCSLCNMKGLLPE